MKLIPFTYKNKPYRLASCDDGYIYLLNKGIVTIVTFENSKYFFMWQVELGLKVIVESMIGQEEFF